MTIPYAFTTSGKSLAAYKATFDPSTLSSCGTVDAKQDSPTIILVRSIEHGRSASIISRDDIISFIPGSLEDVWVIEANDATVVAQPIASHTLNDDDFVRTLDSMPHDVAAVAQSLLRSIRSQGVDGYLECTRDGKWINRPINSFTLKVQPRAGNVSFTVYGEPHKHDNNAMLKKDQNSYSRGATSHLAEIEDVAKIVAQAHFMKTKRA